MILSWKNPLIRMVGWLKVNGGQSCVWCSNHFRAPRRLDASSAPFCSEECERRFKITRRVALGLRKAPNNGDLGRELGLPGLQTLGQSVVGGTKYGGTGERAVPVVPRKKKKPKLVSAEAVGYYENDELAKRYGIPRLSFMMRMPVGYDCHYCGKKGGGVTRDHIVADSKGGSNLWFNLVPACVDCQRKKGSGDGDCDCLYCLRSRKLHAEAEKAQKLLR